MSKIPPERDITDPHSIMWHHMCHEKWADEKLHFFRFQFEPTYNSTAIFSKLADIVTQQVVFSYAMYELTGQYDILLRVWLPNAISVPEFQRTIMAHLGSLDAVAMDPFQCEKIVSHWVWDDGEGGVLMPAEHILATVPDDNVLKKIQEQKDDEAKRLRSGFASDLCLREWRPKDGIRFMLEVPKSGEVSLSCENQKTVERGLLRILVGRSDIYEISLYRGSGFAEFIVLGKVKPDKFDSINSEIIEKINNLGLVDDFNIRTRTAFLIRGPQWGTELCEKIPDSKPRIAQTLQEKTVDELLSVDESLYLEFKGYYSLCIKRWLNGDGKKESKPSLLTSGAIKAIVGMLNSYGGRVVLGVLEKDKWASVKFQESISAWPSNELYLIPGLEIDPKYYSTCKGNWDTFELMLADQIKKQIEPDPHHFVRIRREEYKGKVLCVITVTQPNLDWYYIKGDAKLYRREGNSTLPLSGPDADRYRLRLLPRGI